LILLALVGFVYSQGLDFLIDNIFLPLLTDITNNAVNLLSESLLSLIGLIGKRDLIQQHITNLINNLQAHITNLIETVAPQVINLINKPRINVQSLVSNILSNFNIEFGNIASHFVSQITSVLSHVSHVQIETIVNNVLTNLNIELSQIMNLATMLLNVNLSNLIGNVIPSNLIALIGKRDVSQIFQVVLSLLSNFDFNQILSQINLGTLLSMIPANLVSLIGKRDLISTIQSHIEATLATLQLPTQVVNLINSINTNLPNLVAQLGKRGLDLSTIIPIVLALLPESISALIANFNMNMIPNVIATLAQLG